MNNVKATPLDFNLISPWKKYVAVIKITQY